MMLVSTRYFYATRANPCMLSSLSGQKRVLNDLCIQRSHLNYLLRDKSAIWPPNREKAWRKELLSFVLRLSLFGALSVQLPSIFLVTIAAWYSGVLLAEKNEMPMNFQERLFFFEVYLYVHLALDLFFGVTISMITNFHDKTKQLNVIKKRSIQLTEKLAKLRSQFQGHNDDEDRTLAEEAASQEALQIYLILRVFSDQIQPLISSASIHASLCFLESAAILAIVVSVSWNGKPLELYIMTGLVIILAFTFNGIFLICASFNSACERTTLYAWSIVASFTVDDGNSIASADICGNGSCSRHLRQSIVDDQVGDHAALIPHGGSLINLHTAQLWRRLISDTQAFHKKSTCYILGLIPVNFSKALSLNFWSISAVLIYLTQSQPYSPNGNLRNP